ncbi:MAG: tetratricopeptide repeat protein [Longimicrobiaceae bacterium]
MERARHQLSSALYELRKAVGEEVILAAGDELRLNPALIRADVAEFEGALKRGDHEEAVSLYSGPFLDGFFLSDAPEFERWTDGERERLRRAYHKALEAVAAEATAHGLLEDAVGWWRRLAAADPYSSRVTLRLMEVLEAAGDRAGAIQQARMHTLLLQEELELQPDPAVTALVERVRAEPAVPVASDLRRGSEKGDGISLPSITLPPSRMDTIAGASIAAQPAASANGQAPAMEPGLEVAGSSERRRRGLRLALQWGGVVGLVGLVALLAASWLRRPPSLHPQRVLVTVFENQTGNPALDPVGRMAADWIARGLMETRSIEVVSPTSALYAGYESEGRDIRSMAGQAGAGTVVAGVYYLEGGVLHFHAQVTDAVRGRLLHTLEPVSVPVDSATAGAELLRQRVAAVMAARFDWSHELREITVRARPPTYAAYAAYLEGVELFHRGHYVRAIGTFEQAWAIDTTFYLPRLWTALMYWNLNSPPQMDSVLHSIALYRDRLSPLERIWLAHFQALLAGDNETAFRTIRQMAAMAPGTWLGGLSVLAVLTNRPREAVDALRQLDREQGFLRDWDSSYWLTTAQHILGEHRQELKEARKERLRHPDMLSTLFTEVRALAALGRVKEVERLLRESLSLPAQPGYVEPADVMRDAAAELRTHGHADAAARTLDKALAWYRTRPDPERQEHRAALAQTLYAAQRWEEARALFEELAAEQPENIHRLGYLGTLAARRGERAEAERISTMLASSTQPYLLGAHTLWRARIAAQLGDSEQALLLLREALAQGQPYVLRLHTDVDLDPLRDQRAFRELLRPKG